MTPEAVLHTYVGAFVDELARAGIRDACVCPGSRSTPLALMLAEHPAIKLWMHYDERSAGFFALGMAKARRSPVALLCTSGTAAANFMPAVVEARYGRVPLVVLTADRPPEMQEVGAAQTIDQTRLYGQHVKWFAQALLPEASDDALRFVRTLAGRAVATAAAAPAGPVHLNMPFREPLVPLALEVRADQPRAPGRDDAAWHGRPGGEPYVRVSASRAGLDPATAARLAGEIGAVERGLIVCGPQDDPALAPAVARLAEALGWPLLADPLSGARRGTVVDAYDALLRDGSFVERMAPEIVLRLGGLPTSKPVLQYLQRHAGARQIAIDAPGGWQEPTALAAELIHADATLACEALALAVADRRRAGAAASTNGAASASTNGAAGTSANGAAGARADGGPATSTNGAAAGPDGAAGSSHADGGAWAASWRRANEQARAAIESELGRIDEPFEGKAFAELAEVLPDGAVLWAGSSMPVRDLDTFFPASDRRIHFLSNRGANGIDGVVSSALGAAAAGARPLVLAIGDVSFYHDLNGLLAAKLHVLDATIVLLNNDGGGIFSFLPQAAHPAHFEQLFGTPHGLDFRPAVEMYGGRFERVESWPDFRSAVAEGIATPGLSVIELPTDRARNVELHRRFWPAVSRAIAPLAVG